MLEDVRERRGHLTIWLCSNLKKALYVHWETDEGFKRRHLTNRNNRTSARSSKYTGRSATFMKTKSRLSKSLSHDVTMTETFKYTHTMKKNKERFIDQQAADHYQTGDDVNNSGTAEVDPNTVWCDTASDPYKNCIYGLGSFFVDNLRTSALRHLSTSTTSRSVDPEDGVDLREQVLELTRSFHQQQSEEKYQEILTCISNKFSQAGVEMRVGATSADEVTNGGVPRTDAGQLQQRC
ncbi:hypothetical protein Ahy_B10g100726 [Arachis hypogaea]|uniref:Uncharacterized protein n=1 Tax=Arachis hypogaea TaxID=3818 RepID=A0A444WXK1_ARAHY|nr:hypothetical protein Ahy_B10g100726 [Arachis hypogaea]